MSQNYTALKEGRHTGEFLISSQGSYSLDVGLLLGGASVGILAAGTVLKVDATGKYAPAAAADEAVAILYDNVNATSGNVSATIVTRQAEVKGSALSYGGAVELTAAQKTTKATQLKAVGIIVR